MVGINVWLLFLLSGSLVVGAGLLLARFAQTIERETSLGGVWVGAILLAGATSLPELVTSVTSGLLQVPDIGAGNLFGSTLLNLMVLAVLDLVDGRCSILTKVGPGHILSATLGMTLSAVAAISILARLDIGVAHIGFDTIFLLLAYLFAIFLMGRFQKRAQERSLPQDETSSPGRSRRMVWVYLGFGLSAAGVMIGGSLLVGSAEDLARVTGLGTTFVGSTMVALVTSLPELVIGFALVIRGALDIAVGNILGSNLMNMAMLIVIDASYLPGRVLSQVSPVHALTGLGGLILTSIAVVGLIYRSERNYAGLGPDTALMVGAYLIISYLLFALS